MTTARSSAYPGGIRRLEQIAADRLAPVIPPPSPNPTVQEAMEAWMAMARGYASIVVRQHEFEAVSLSVLRDFDNRLANIETRLEALTDNVDVDVEEDVGVKEPATIPPPMPSEAPTLPR